MRRERIAIIGAGIGGLTAALALARRGFEVRLHEQSQVLEEIGAGLQLSPNAFGVLEDLGLGEALRPFMVEPTAITIRRGRDGRPILRLALSAARQRWGAAYAVIHRADLQHCLLEEASANRAITLQLGQQVTGVDPAGRMEIAGAWHPADCLVGADGVWSTTRAAVGVPPPRFSGRRAWRATLAADAMPEELRDDQIGLWLGPNAHLVHYPLRAGAIFNVVAITEDGDPSPGWWRSEDGADSLMAGFEGWAEPLRRLLGRVQSWASWPLFDAAPSHHLAKDRLALLGDAAHPMLPFLAQGAAMAIEDAAVLATCLADEGRTIPARLAAYSAARLERAARVQREARTNGERYHWSGVRAECRDLGLRALGGERLLKRYDWLYGWRGSDDLKAPPVASP